MSAGNNRWGRERAAHLALAALWRVHIQVVDSLVGMDALVDSTNEGAFCGESPCVACLGLARGLLKC